MNDQLKALSAEFQIRLDAVNSAADLEQLEIDYLGRKAGKLTAVLRSLKDLESGERQVVGMEANQLKQTIERAIAEKKTTLGGEPSDLIDVTLPGETVPEGHLHLVTKAIHEITGIFKQIGFQQVSYPEVEWDWYAFESLNMPQNHPARDEWETFFIDTAPVGPKGQRILTPHTSSGQVREMERRQPPIRMMNISKCYRRQSDISHVPMFHQFEGCVIDEHITVAHLRGVLDYFVKNFFGPEREVRIRPYHFQFTEPSFEIDVSVEKGVEKIGKSGWLELGGAGMMHPNVIKAGGLDPKKYSGLAFGWGVERTYMMKSGLQIPDIRMLYQNDMRFLKQF